MFSEAIYIFYGLMGGLAIVCVYFLIASVFWHQEDTQFEGKPVHTELAQHLTDLRFPKKKMQETVDRMAEVVQREVVKQTQKMQTETRQVLTEKEAKIKEITQKFEKVEQHYQVLGKQKTQTESVVRSIAGGVIVLDDNGKVVFLNPDAEKILGHRAKDLLGKQMNQMKGDHVISMVNEEGMEEKTAAAGDSAKQELKEHTAVIETVGGQTRGVISLMPSRTSDTRMEEYKNEFLANITHELRSPLVCIQKSISSISGKVSGEEKAYLDIAIRNAARLEKLVNEILDLSKLESGKIFLRYEIMTLKSFAEEITGNFYAWAQDKQIELKLELPDEAGVFEGDKDKLGQVLSNLIANAVKFTPRRGKITVTGKFSPAKQGSSGSVEIAVRDTGPGLSEEDRTKVFKKFAFINTKPTEGEPSTGLGLSISKQIVDLHNGKIWVDSAAGQGSCFAFSVPAQKPASA